MSEGEYADNTKGQGKQDEGWGTLEAKPRWPVVVVVNDREGQRCGGECIVALNLKPRHPGPFVISPPQK